MKAQSFLLGLYFFSLPFELWPFNIGYRTISISMLISMLYSLSMVPLLIKKPFAVYVEYKRFILPLAIFFIYLTLINIININNINSTFLNSSIFLSTILLFIIIIHGYNDPKAIRTALFYYVLGTILMSLLFYLGIGVEYAANRLIIFGNNPNSIGVKMSLGIVFLLTEIILYDSVKLKKFRFLFILPLPLMFLFVVETGSRLALISLFMAFGLSILLYKTKKYIKIFFILIGIITVTVSLNIIISNNDLYNRFLSSAISGDTAGRTDLWVSLLPDIKKNFIFGVGETGYSLISLNSLNMLYDDIKGYSPHNVLIELILFTGLIGMISYLLFWIRLSKTALRAYRKYNYITNLIVLIFIFGQITGGHLLVYKSYYAMYACIIISSTSLYHRKLQVLTKSFR